jgi:Ca2+-binding EF-hand superfamily protein
MAQMSSSDPITKLFSNHDYKMKGKIDKVQLRSCLSDLAMKELNNFEYSFLSSLFQDDENESISLNSFKSIIESFNSFC